MLTGLLVLILGWTSTWCGVPDSLTAFNAAGGYHYYRVAGIRMQAMRFEPLAACRVAHVSVLLAGDAAQGRARLRLFGSEAGAPAPMLGEDLIAPMVLRKSRPGPEWIDVQLPKTLRIASHQFFVAVDSLAGGALLVTDADRKLPSCLAPGFDHGAQSIQTDDGRWWTNAFGYGITAFIEYEHDGEQAFEEISEHAGFEKRTTTDCGIACADYDADGNIDVLAGGRLYRNLGGGSFRDVSEVVGLRGVPRANLFFDANGDHLIDILFLGSANSKGAGSVLFLADADGRFHATNLNIPDISIPTSFSAADVDNDGYVDLFVGQGADSTGHGAGDRLLVNNRHGGFTDRTTLLGDPDTVRAGSQGSQWIDVDADGFPDLYVVHAGADGVAIWRNNGDATFSELAGRGSGMRLASGNAIGGAWRNDGPGLRPDLLLVRHAALAEAGARASAGIMAAHDELRRAGFRSVDLSDRGIPFSEYRGDIVGADIDNDGDADYICTAAAPCHFSDFYAGAPDDHFQDATAAFGLLHRSLGPRAVWLDVDNDGRPDLLTQENGALRLFRNALRDAGAYVDVDLGPGSEGARVELHAGAVHRYAEVSSGRGLLTQDPPRLHFGVADARRIDSVIVRWADGRTFVARDVPVNSVLRLAPQVERLATIGTVLSAVRAYPNPFSQDVRIVFRLERSANVRLEIIGLDGRTVVVLADGDRGAGLHDVLWDGLGADGGRMPQGRYLYRLRVDSEEAGGSLVLQR